MGRKRRDSKPPSRDPVDLDIVDITHDGRGVARQDGKAVFVFGALPGERVRCHLTRSTRHFDEAQVEKVLQAAAERVTPVCDHFGQCGGCVLQHLQPEEQTAFKHRVLMENLRRLGKVEPEEWAEPLYGDPWHYRRRARLSGRALKEGSYLLGFRQRQGKQIEPLQSCPVLDERAGSLQELADCLNGLEARQDIPQVELSFADDQVVLVVRHMRPLAPQDVQALRRFCQQKQWQLWLQPEGPDSVRPVDDHQDQPCFSLPEEGLNYHFAPLDFIQVNGAMNRRMVAQAMDWLQPGPEDRVLDLFCGLGNFTLPLARRAGQVTGVEGEEGLVQRARRNAQENGLDVDFHVADLRQDHRAREWAQRDYTQVLIDPPRTGAVEVLPLIAHLAPRHILYVSCHPGSLARDAGILVRDHGYRLLRAGAMDMFPHTAHVESMALFERA